MITLGSYNYILQTFYITSEFVVNRICKIRLLLFYKNKKSTKLETYVEESKARGRGGADTAVVCKFLEPSNTSERPSGPRVYTFPF